MVHHDIEKHTSLKHITYFTTHIDGRLFVSLDMVRGLLIAAVSLAEGEVTA